MMTLVGIGGVTEGTPPACGSYANARRCQVATPVRPVTSTSRRWYQLIRPILRGAIPRPEAGRAKEWPVAILRVPDDYKCCGKRNNPTQHDEVTKRFSNQHVWTFRSIQLHLAKIFVWSPPWPRACGQKFQWLCWRCCSILHETAQIILRAFCKVLKVRPTASRN